MVTEQIPTRAAQRDHYRRELWLELDRATKRVHEEPEDEGLTDEEAVAAWKGVRIVTRKELDEAVNAVFGQPLPPPAEHVAEISTPATVMVTAFCPRCRQAQLMDLTDVEPDLIVHSNGNAELKLHAKTKARAHVCGQLPMPVSGNGAQMAAFDPTADGGDRENAIEDDGELTPAVVHDLLLIVLAPTELPSIEVVEGWTPEQLDEVAAWAGAVHLVASDHDDVEIPPKPAVLEEHAAGDVGEALPEADPGEERPL